MEVLQGNTTLRISKSGMEHAGRYACEATNKAGGDEKYFDLEIIGGLGFRLFKIFKTHSL